MQALGPDILEAIAHAQTMTPEDVEETIDYILNEVLLSLHVTADIMLTPRFEYSMGKTSSVAPDVRRTL